jgi:hypothetical protein
MEIPSPSEAEVLLGAARKRGRMEEREGNMLAMVADKDEKQYL